jgi:hypothetical protein
MSERRFRHAPDEAPLYRVSEAIGGQAWPAYRVYGEGRTGKVVLDVNGILVEFFDSDVTEVTRPEGLPDWALDIAAALFEYEAMHGHPDDSWTCFAALLEQIPDEAKDFITARKQVSR